MNKFAVGDRFHSNYVGKQYTYEIIGTTEEEGVWQWQSWVNGKPFGMDRISSSHIQEALNSNVIRRLPKSDVPGGRGKTIRKSDIVSLIDELIKSVELNGGTKFLPSPEKIYEVWKESLK